MSQIDFEKVATHLLENNIRVPAFEKMLVITDASTSALAEGLHEALEKRIPQCEILHMKDSEKSGQEPPRWVTEKARDFEVVLAMTRHSLTHTKARKELVNRGCLFLTMPGITSEMLQDGALFADYSRVVRETRRMAQKLSDADLVTIYTGENSVLKVPVRGVEAISSEGVFASFGSGGNVPSGEAFLAPVEGEAKGTYLVDGSVAGIGLVGEPIELTIDGGRLVSAAGEQGRILLDLLGEGLGRNVAELGLGTNHKARLIGEILEDEKAFGTVHIAFGSNHTFGGTVDAGVHIDCISRTPRIEFS